ncbi:plasmid replication protein RepC [Rubrimonas cliftonensis]|uniref:Replication protein C C-terminal region n=1 Tax=Rubrimonas cliftonensis TaxID=89524 RepID=A0A1H4CWC9_9RHOB|nr:plasmid replication protein RepC [Rubrimonas cliftonensis]SEA64773.1 Replication protein C C-terminal region [Rubrimonas cliftonensis]
MLIETEAAHPPRRAPAPSGRDDLPSPAARPNPGQRRSTPAGRRADALAEAWAGLPEGVTRWRLVAALRAAARALSLSSPMLRLMEHYVDLTYDQDWAEDSEPVICRPLTEIAEHLGRSERQVRNIERALVERGLLAFRDSGNHARKGRRDRKTGRLVYAYGPSLAPFGARAGEVIALAAAARADIAEGRRLRMAVSALRRRLKADLDAADAAGIEATALRAALDAAPARLPAAMPADALRGLRDDLADLAARVLEALGGACPEDDAPAWSKLHETSARPAIDGSPETDTSKKNAASGSGIALKKAKTAAGREGTIDAPVVGGGKDERARTAHPDNGVGAIPLALALAAAGPEIGALARETAAARGGPPNWPVLIDAARTVAPMLGIDQTLWGEACGRLGRGGAVLATIILARGAARAGPEDGGAGAGVGGAGLAPIRRPAAYLRELLARADRGELHLDRSIRALAATPCGDSPEPALRRAAP